MYGGLFVSLEFSDISVVLHLFIWLLKLSWETKNIKFIPQQIQAENTKQVQLVNLTKNFKNR